MVQVALDLPVDGIAGLGAGDLRAPELLVEGRRGKVANVREHAADREARGGAFAGLVVATAEIRVLLDARAGDGVERDGHGRLAETGGQDGDAADLPRVVRAPQQSLHPAHGTADDRVELGDAEVADDHALGANDIPQRDLREKPPEAAAGPRVDGQGAGGTLATADAVHADDEEAIRVDGLAGPDEHIPPARLDVVRPVAARHVVVAAQRVGHEDRVGLVRQQGAVRLVAQGQLRQHPAQFQREGLGRVKILERDRAELGRGGGGLDRDGGHGPDHRKERRDGGKWPFGVATS